MRPEMRLVEPPQRLHRNIERPFAQSTEALALLDQRAEFARGPRQNSRRIEARDLAVFPVEAEHPFVAFDFGAGLEDCATREGRIGVPERQLRIGAKDVALPVE